MKTESFAHWVPPIIRCKPVFERRSDGHLWPCYIQGSYKKGSRSSLEPYSNWDKSYNYHSEIKSRISSRTTLIPSSTSEKHFHITAKPQEIISRTLNGRRKKSDESKLVLAKTNNSSKFHSSPLPNSYIKNNVKWAPNEKWCNNFTSNMSKKSKYLPREGISLDHDGYNIQKISRRKSDSDVTRKSSKCKIFHSLNSNKTVSCPIIMTNQSTSISNSKKNTSSCKATAYNCCVLSSKKTKSTPVITTNHSCKVRNIKGTNLCPSKTANTSKSSQHTLKGQKQNVTHSKIKPKINISLNLELRKNTNHNMEKLMENTSCSKKTSTIDNDCDSLFPVLKAIQCNTFADMNIMDIPLLLTDEDLSTIHFKELPQKKEHTPCENYNTKYKSTKESNKSSQHQTLKRKNDKKNFKDGRKSGKKYSNRKLLDEYQMTWGPWNDEQDAIQTEDEHEELKTTTNLLLSATSSSCVNDVISKMEAWFRDDYVKNHCSHQYVKHPVQTSDLQNVKAKGRKKSTKMKNWNWDSSMTDADTCPPWFLNLIEGRYSLKYK